MKPHASTIRSDDIAPSDPDKSTDPDNLSVLDMAPDLGNARKQVLDWLSRRADVPPARLLYDARGAILFEDICATDEYYLTQTEMSLLPQVVEKLAELVDIPSQIVEYGSGNNKKVRMLIDTLPYIRAHAPIDISRDHLLENARELAIDYPQIDVTAICADFFTDITLPSHTGKYSVLRNIGFFPGSTIGNMVPAKSVELMRHARTSLGDGSFFVLAADRMKDEKILLDAYHDTAGASAAFSLNLIDRINREMDGTLDKSAFRYDVRLNRQSEAVEMYWRVEKPHKAQACGATFSFERGDEYLVEVSRKFTADSLHQLAEDAGYHVDALLSDANDWYTLAILQAQ